MSIHKLPDYVINRLKAGEVVDKPSSILKELIENSLDAGATKIEVTINDGGKSYLSVQDNGSGIELSDMDLVLERYATSKIQTDEDLYQISSYGFRGEALASIAEVSKTTILTKTKYAEIGTKLVKKGGELIMKHQPAGFDHGTVISVEDIFFNVPARLKFLKSAQTEFFYCYNVFVNVALWHYDKEWVMKKNDKVSFDLKPARELKDRIVDLFKKDRGPNLRAFEYEHQGMRLTGVVSDASLRFGSGENIRIYVNGRAVDDKIIRKALMDAYHRQITPGEYPFVMIMLEIDPKLVDVNVHPAKLHVKFAHSKEVYEAVFAGISEALGGNKISNYQGEHHTGTAFSAPASPTQGTVRKTEEFLQGTSGISTPQVQSIFGLDAFVEGEARQFFHQEIGEYQVIGQLWNSYIILQSQQALYYVDQHALAERIAYEEMKKAEDLSAEILLQPLKFEITQVANIPEKMEQLNQLGFDIAMLGENVIVVYAIPKIFVTHPIDMQTLLNHVLYLETITFAHLMEGVYASRACKTSIKAGHKLSLPQMEQLIQDGFDKIPGLFVCQHGRPFFIRTEKADVDKLFDR